MVNQTLKFDLLRQSLIFASMTFFVVDITGQDNNTAVVTTKITRDNVFGALYSKLTKIFPGNQENESSIDVSGVIVDSTNAHEYPNGGSEVSNQKLKSLINETKIESTTTLASVVHSSVGPKRRDNVFGTLYSKLTNIFPGNQENESTIDVSGVIVDSTNALEYPDGGSEESNQKLKSLTNETKPESTTTLASLVHSSVEPNERGFLEKLYDKIGHFAHIVSDRMPNSTSSKVTATTTPMSELQNEYENLFNYYYYRVKNFLKGIANVTKNRIDDIQAEVQYCKDRMEYNRRLAEMTSEKKLFSFQTLKQSYDMTKEYWKLKEEGKKYKFCGDRSILSWRMVIGRSWLKRLIGG